MPPVSPFASTQVAAPSKQDEEQLDLLGVLYWAYGGLIALAGIMFGLFGIIPAIMIATAPNQPKNGEPSPLVFGGIFLILFGFVALLLIAKGVTMFFVGRALRTRTRWMLCFVGAALCVMNFPLGTALAVFTFVLLIKPHIKQRFGVT
jgi:hypothetical protein